MSATTNGHNVDVNDRQYWLGVLARATLTELEEAWSALPVKPEYRFLRPPETGLAQIRARAGGTGQQFNLGEVTLSRCTVQLLGGAVGVGYVTGRVCRRAELVAVFDVLLQEPSHAKQIRINVIDPLAMAHQQRRSREAESTALTKVDFFTMVRGDG